VLEAGNRLVITRGASVISSAVAPSAHAADDAVGEGAGAIREIDGVVLGAGEICSARTRAPAASGPALGTCTLRLAVLGLGEGPALGTCTRSRAVCEAEAGIEEAGGAVAGLAVAGRGASWTVLSACARRVQQRPVLVSEPTPPLLAAAVTEELDSSEDGRCGGRQRRSSLTHCSARCRTIALKGEGGEDGEGSEVPGAVTGTAHEAAPP
jgi:hypothetical protein